MQTILVIVLTVALITSIVMNFVQFRSFGKLLQALKPLMAALPKVSKK